MTVRAARHILVNRLAMPIAAFFLLVIIGRHSSALLGEYALVTTFFFVMQTLPLLGLTPFVMREVARDPTQTGTLFSTVGLLALCASLVVGQCAIWVVGHAPYSGNVRQAVWVVGLSILPGTLAFLAEQILISLRHASVVAWVAIVENLLRLVISAILVLWGADVDSLIWVLLLTRSLALACYVTTLYGGRLVKICLPSYALIQRIVPILPVFLLSTIMAVVVSRLDYLILSLNLDTESLGYYAIAYRALEIAQLMVAALLTSAFSRLAQLWHTDKAALIALLRTLLPTALGVFFVIASVASGFAELYVRVLFSRQYPEPVLLAQLFSLVLPIVAIDALLSSTLLAADRQNSDVVSLAVGTSIYAIGLFLLVPHWQGSGALAALLLATMAQLSLRLRAVSVHIGTVLNGQRMIVVVVTGLACTALTIASVRSFGVWAGPFVLLAIPTFFFLMSNMLGGVGWMDLIAESRIHVPCRPLSSFSGVLDHLAEDARADQQLQSREQAGRAPYRRVNYKSAAFARFFEWAHLNDYRSAEWLLRQLAILCRLPPEPAPSDLPSDR